METESLPFVNKVFVSSPEIRVVPQNKRESTSYAGANSENNSAGVSMVSTNRPRFTSKESLIRGMNEDFNGEFGELSDFERVEVVSTKTFHLYTFEFVFTSKHFICCLFGKITTRLSCAFEQEPPIFCPTYFKVGLENAKLLSSAPNETIPIIDTKIPKIRLLDFLSFILNHRTVVGIC